MRLDIEGSGVPTLYKFIMGGSHYKLLDYILVITTFYFLIHTVFGRSIVSMLMDDQTSTSMLRGVLDNIALTNTPRLAVVDSQVNLDDVLNNEVGAVIRQRQPGGITPITIPFTAGNTLGAMQYMDQQVEQKVGVSNAGVGLNPDVLQSTTKTAVDFQVANATQQVEIIARNLAEGGLSQLFRKMLQLAVKIVARRNDACVNVPINPRTWNTEMDLQINVGLVQASQKKSKQR